MVGRLPALDNLLRELNASQAEAVRTTEGPLLVLAGAGTGKTRVITYRIAHLLLRGVQPENILGVTFTNKAAREMRERIGAVVRGRSPKGLTLSTFHALGVRILKAEAEALGLRKNFTIYDQGDQLAVLRTVLRDLRGAVSSSDAKGILATISLAKNRSESPEDLIVNAVDEWEYMIGRAYARYQEALQSVHCVDFDDLILLPVQLLRENEEIRAKYQDRFRYLLVDEYQDTNGAQYRFTHALVGPDRNICVVGDDDQSIYGFRGAEMDKILSFEKDFPGAKVVKLEENYRCTAPILDLANAVIANNTERHDKTLRAMTGTGVPVQWVTSPDGDEEVDWVVREILKLTQGGGRRPSDIAILMRSAIQARPFEEKLRLRQIPYKLVGGNSYFDRKEIRDCLAYWGVVHNPQDEMSLLRIINTPKRGIGNTTIKKLDELARERKTSLFQGLELVADGEGQFSNKVRAELRELVDAVLRARRLESEGRFVDLCEGILEDVGYRESLAELYTDPLTLTARWNSVENLIELVERFQKANADASLGDFLEAIALREEQTEDDKDADELVIQTLHSSKGLEFPIVFLVGVEEEFLPHKKSIEDGDRGIEEERRLFYVGITRAREVLYLTAAASRRAYGRDHARRSTRFLTELEDGSALVTSGSHQANNEPTKEDVLNHLAEYRKLRELQDG